jgi:AraC-like DNA-binding protein
MRVKRRPVPALRPFVDLLWAIDETDQPRSMPRREHVLPCGQMHVVFLLADEPLRLFADARDASSETVSEAVIGGARGSFYIREAADRPCSVGAQLRPGAALALFGVPADELSDRHTALADIWGNSVSSMHEQLAELPTPVERLDALEAMLAARLPRARGVHPAIAEALDRFVVSTNVGDMVHRSGYSHRFFNARFRESVGLTPKLYSRVLRFQRVLRHIFAEESSWLDLALTAGYSDQAHFNREFKEFAGTTPTAYRQASPHFAHHVPVSGELR